MAQSELSSARKDDLENTERDIFAPKSRIPKTPSWWQRVKVRSVGLISVTCLSFIKQTMRQGKPAGRPPTG